MGPVPPGRGEKIRSGRYLTEVKEVGGGCIGGSTSYMCTRSRIQVWVCVCVSVSMCVQEYSIILYRIIGYLRVDRGFLLEFSNMCLKPLP